MGSWHNGEVVEMVSRFLEFDPMLCQPGPSNPWITDDQTHRLLNQKLFFVQK